MIEPIPFKDSAVRVCGTRRTRLSPVTAHLLAAALCILPAGAMAADFAIEDPVYSGDRLNHATISVRGDISKGDLKKLDELLSLFPDYETGFNESVAVLSLDSPGGDHAEAVLIGSLLRTKGVGTRVPAGSSCIAACAVMFMHGTVRLDGEEFPNRKLHPAGKLGFQAPYLTLPEGAIPTREMVSGSYADALLYVATLIESGGTTFDQELLMKMLRTQRGEMLMVETYGDLLTWDIPLDAEYTKKHESLTYEQLVIACANTHAVAGGVRPTITPQEAQEAIQGGYGPKLAGVHTNGDMIYSYLLDGYNSIACNIGLGRHDDGSVRARYYGDTYIDESGPKPIDMAYSWLDPRYFIPPSEHFYFHEAH